MKTTTIQVIFFSLFMFASNAQNTYDANQLNRAILREFNGDQIQTLMDTDPQRLEKIILYFTQSFQVEDYNCATCIVDYNDFFNISLFNIYDHESERLDNNESSLIFKEKYLITFLSKSDLNTLLGGITPFELINGLPERPFPSWISYTNDHLDFENYKEEIINWSNDFPKQFLAIKKSPNVLKMRFAQFAEMTSDEKNAVLSFPGGYIIVDEEIMSYPQ